MKRHDSKTMEAERLVDVLLSATNVAQVSEALGSFTTDEIRDIASAHLHNGHTLTHLLAQRDKLLALRVLLQRGVCVQARDARGATPLHTALQQNRLLSAQVLIGVGGANPSEVISKPKGTTLLHHMVACERPKAVRLLLQNKADVNARNREGRTPFHLAAVYGHSKVAAILLQNDQCDINACDGAGHTALMLAILNSNRDLARQLVDSSRVDVVLKDPKDRSALHMAIMAGQLAVVRALLSRNSGNLHCKEGAMGRAPIHLACALVCSRAGVVTSNCVFDEDARDEDHAAATEHNDNAINVVQKEKNVDRFVNWLLQLEAFDVDMVPSSQEGVGMLREILPSLLWKRGLHAENIANIVLDLPQDRSSLLRTLRVALPEIAHLMQGVWEEQGFKCQAQDKPSRAFSKRKSTVYSAFKQRVLKSPSQLRARGEESALGKRGGPSVASRHSISEGILKHGPGAQDLTPHPSGIQGCKLSTTARGPPKTVPALKKSSFRRPATAPASTNTQDQSTASVSFNLEPDESLRMPRRAPSPSISPSTITQFNVSLVRCRMVALLLDFGADVNLMTSFRKSPLHIACILGAADVVALLLPKVNNVNVMSASNKTALHLAVEKNHKGIVAQLIAAGANLKLRDVSGMTALHIAARNGFADITRSLVKGKADINLADFKQMTPIHHAYANNHAGVIEILTSAGAFLDVVDVSGQTPLDYRMTASGSSHPEQSTRSTVEFSLSEGSYQGNDSLGESGRETDVSDSEAFGELSSGEDSKSPDLSQGKSRWGELQGGSHADPIPRIVLDSNGNVEGSDTGRASPSQSGPAAAAAAHDSPQPALDFQRPGLAFRR